MEDDFTNIFEEEYDKIAESKTYTVLSDVLKISLLDDNNEFRISLSHIPTLFFLDDDKDGRFTKENFSNLSKVYQQKEKVYKRYEFRSQLQAHFTLLMWKQVCSKEGEKAFTEWIRTLLIEAQNNMDTHESQEDINPDPANFIGRHTLKLFYEILNVKITHGVDFQSFFDLMQLVSETSEVAEFEDNEAMEDYIHITVLDFFCKNFIRGFSKLIIDLGFDSLLIDDLE